MSKTKDHPTSQQVTLGIGARLRTRVKQNTQRQMRRVKKTSKSTIKRMKFALGEHIRVVPLHHPEPPIWIAELSRVRRAPEAETVDCFDGAAHPARASARLGYRNGVGVANAKLFT